MKISRINNIQEIKLPNLQKGNHFIWGREKDSFIKSKPSFKGFKEDIPEKQIIVDKCIYYNDETIRKNEEFLEGIKSKNSPYHNCEIGEGLFDILKYANVQELLDMAKIQDVSYYRFENNTRYLMATYDRKLDKYSIKEVVLDNQEKQMFKHLDLNKSLTELFAAVASLEDDIMHSVKKDESIRPFFRSAFQKTPHDKDLIEEVFKILIANKVKSPNDFVKVAKEYSALETTEIDILTFLTMRSALDNKYFNEFKEVLSEGVIQERTFEENTQALEYYQKLLKLFRVSTPEQFREKFSALENDFDAFDTPKDIFKTIYFLGDNLIDLNTYERYLREYSSDTMTFGEFIDSKDTDEKVEELDLILSEIETTKKKQTGEIIYQNYREIIDYYYETNGANLFGFKEYLEKLLEYDGKLVTVPTRHLDKTEKNQSAKTSINFTKTDSKLSAENKIELLKTLIKYDIEPKTFQSLAEKNLLDVEFKTYLENFENMPSEIAEATGLSEEEAKNKYLACKNIYTALKSSDLGLEAKDIAKFIAKFKIENDESLIALGQSLEHNFRKIEKKEDITRIYKLLAYSNIKNAEELAEFNAECKRARRKPTEEIKVNERKYLEFEKEFNKYLAKNKGNTEVEEFYKGLEGLYVWQNYFKTFDEIKNMSTGQILEYIADENILSDSDYFAIPAQLRNSKDSAYSTFNAINAYLRNTDNKEIKEFFKGQSGEEIVEKYSEILSAELGDKNTPAQISRALNFISKFNIQDNEDFKNKFKNTNTKDDIRNLISSLTKANITNIEEYRLIEKNCIAIPEVKFIKSNKLPQFAKELSIFKEDNPDFAQKLEKNNLNSPIKLYFAFPALFKTFEENGHGNGFKEAFEFLEKSDIKNTQEYEEKFKPFYEYLETEEDVLNYVQSAGMDFSKESYVKTCLNVLKAIHDKRTPETTFKKAKKFAKNFLTQSSKRENKIKTPYDTLKKSFIKDGDIESIKKFISFLEKREIVSIESFNSQLDEFKDENGDASSAIKLFKKVSDKITIDDFTKSLKSIKESVKKFKEETGITNSALLDINYSLLDEEDLKLNFNDKNEIFKIIKKLTHGKIEKSVLTSFINCYTNEEKMSITKSSVAKEFVRVERMGYEPYDNIKKALKLSKSDLGLDENSSEEEYKEAIYQNIPQEFMDFINSDFFSKELKSEGKTPKISIHAKLRLIDRFVLSKGKDASHLYSKKAKEEMQDVLKAVYNQDPAEIKLLSKDKISSKNITPEKENTYKILFNYNN
ncbi:hypothetical protein IKA15_04480, partial [bacterium]|nr:hypothetical protein [bacterium]